MGKSVRREPVGAGLTASIKRAAIAALSVFGMVFVACAPAQAATEFPPFGASGDAQKRLECAPGEFLVGLNIRSGSWIDQLGLICAGVDQATGQTLATHDGPVFGGSGGGPGAGKCLPGFIIHGTGLLMTNQNRQVRLFVLDCQSTTTVDRHNLDLGNNAPVFPSIFQMCPNGEAVRGMTINYGRHVNAVGLICGAFEEVKIDPPPPPPPPDICAGGGDKVPADWQDMLAVHNERRQLHCAKPLKWCQSLADSAQEYADKCILNQHGSDGENLANAYYIENGSPVIPALSDRDAFENAWYCEIDNYDFNNPKFEGGFTVNCKNVNGHFTQVVWKDSGFLGCGRATCDINGHKGTQWVCRYRPSGNMNVTNPLVLGQQVHRPSYPDCPKE